MKTTTALLLSGLTLTAAAKDWPMWGSDPTRNMVGESKNLPTDINPGELDDETEAAILDSAKNIKWAAKLGSQAYGNTVVGSHVGIDTKGSIVMATPGHTVVTIDVEDLIVVQTNDAVLIADKHCADSIKKLVDLVPKELH